MLSEVVCTQFAEWVDRMPGVTDSLGGGEDRISYHTDTNPLITLPAPIPKRRRTMLLITRDAAAPSCSASSPWGSSSTEWFKLKVTFTLQGKQVQKKCKENFTLKSNTPIVVYQGNANENIFAESFWQEKGCERECR